MKKKGDFSYPAKFPSDDRERVKYSIDIIAKVLILRSYQLPDPTLITANHTYHIEKMAQEENNEKAALLLYTFTDDPEEIQYLWTAALLFGFDPKVIFCKPTPDVDNDSMFRNLFSKDRYDQSDQLAPNDPRTCQFSSAKMQPLFLVSAFSKKSLFELKFKPHISEPEYECLIKARKEINEARAKKISLEQEKKLAEIERQKTEELNKKKEQDEKILQAQKAEAQQRANNSFLELLHYDFPHIHNFATYLDHGADINCQHGKSGDRWIGPGDTALIKATAAGHESIVEYLLHRGANPLIRNDNGQIASDLAIPDSRIHQMLKKRERCIALEKLSPREKYSEHLFDLMDTFDINGRKIDEYLALGADVNYQNCDGFTLLMLSVDKDNERIAEYLLRQGSNPLLRNKFGKSARDYAGRNSGIYTILMGYEVIFLTETASLLALTSLLNEDDSIVNFRCHRGFTPLSVAVEKGLINIVKLLLSRGADIYTIRKDGVTLQDLAPNEEILTLLRLVIQEVETESLDETIQTTDIDSGIQTYDNIPDNEALDNRSTSQQTPDSENEPDSVFDHGITEHVEYPSIFE